MISVSKSEDSKSQERSDENSSSSSSSDNSEMKAMHQFLESRGNDKSKQPQDTEMIEIRKDDKNCDSF